MLGYMASEFFASSPVLLLPIIALGLFVVAFTVLTVRTMRRPRAEIDALAALPLDGEEIGS
jgi:hypothetical protein